jgi:hypothetical protein
LQYGRYGRDEKNFLTGGFMKFIGIILACACLQGAVAMANLDTLWLCRDSIPEGSPKELYFQMYLADTFPDNRGQFRTVDTGESHDGSRYVNFNYRFTTDSVHLTGKTPANTDTAYTIGPRPGYAGFKFYWDNGFVRFYTTGHDSMILWHKGPLPGHKVKMIWAQGGECGGPINYQVFNEFTSSAVWKRESFPFPQKRGETAEFPDSPFVRNGLLELRMLIYNETGDSPTSDPGYLKIDNMCFIKASTAVKDSKYLQKIMGNSRFFVPTVSGKVTLTIYSLQGEQLFKEPINVSAGKKYEVSRFARNNSHLPSSWIHCVKISGSGVNITRKVVR